MHTDEIQVGKDLASVYGQMRDTGIGNRKQISFEHWHVANIMPGLGDTKTNEMQTMSPSSPKGLLGQWGRQVSRQECCDRELWEHRGHYERLQGGKTGRGNFPEEGQSQ